MIPLEGVLTMAHMVAFFKAQVYTTILWSLQTPSLGGLGHLAVSTHGICWGPIALGKETVGVPTWLQVLGSVETCLLGLYQNLAKIQGTWAVLQLESPG